MNEDEELIDALVTSIWLRVALVLIPWSRLVATKLPGARSIIRRTLDDVKGDVAAHVQYYCKRREGNAYQRVQFDVGTRGTIYTGRRNPRRGARSARSGSEL
jgi:hypothetical protein